MSVPIPLLPPGITVPPRFMTSPVMVPYPCSVPPALTVTGPTMLPVASVPMASVPAVTVVPPV